MSTLTLVEISELRGFFAKHSKIASAPMSDNASGNWILNQVRIASRERKRSKSAVGAKRVHVKDLSWGAMRRYIGHRITEY
jgi:hypothetical protein